MTDIGDAPYDLVSPVLVECTAIQLGQIELNSPVRRVLIVVWDDFETFTQADSRPIVDPCSSTQHIRRDSRGPWSTLGILSSSFAIADSETTSTTTGLWKTHTLNEFFEVRSLYEAGEFPEPSNWRKVYLVRRHPF